MGVYAIHHRKPAPMPINTGPGCCDQCWALPGREHGIACPAVEPRHNLRFFRGLLIGLAIVAPIWALIARSFL